MLLEFPRTSRATQDRIYAYLIMSGHEQHEQHDQRDLAEALGMGQASVSTMTRRLIDDGLVDRVGVPGSRRDRSLRDRCKHVGRTRRLQPSVGGEV